MSENCRGGDFLDSHYFHKTALLFTNCPKTDVFAPLFEYRHRICGFHKYRPNPNRVFECKNHHSTTSFTIRG